MGPNYERFVYSFDSHPTCSPDGTITVINPDTETYISAFAKTSDDAQNCTVSLRKAGTEIAVPVVRMLNLMQADQVPGNFPEKNYM